jgi:hypothetical protein
MRECDVNNWQSIIEGSWALKPRLAYVRPVRLDQLIGPAFVEKACAVPFIRCLWSEQGVEITGVKRHSMSTKFCSCSFLRVMLCNSR